MAPLLRRTTLLLLALYSSSAFVRLPPTYRRDTPITRRSTSNAALAAPWAPVPGDSVPSDATPLPTEWDAATATATGPSSFDVLDARNQPAVFNLFDAQSGFARCLWRSNASLAPLLSLGASRTASTHFVFIAREDAGDVKALRLQLKQLILEAHAEHAEHAERTADAEAAVLAASSLWRRLHFVSRPLPELAPWVGELTNAWMTVRATANFTVGSASIGTPNVVTVPRLDARYDWLGWSYDPVSAGVSHSRHKS